MRCSIAVCEFWIAFPGLQEELVAHGALVLDMANDMNWLTPAGWGANFDS